MPDDEDGNRDASKKETEPVSGTTTAVTTEAQGMDDEVDEFGLRIKKKSPRQYQLEEDESHREEEIMQAADQEQDQGRQGQSEPKTIAQRPVPDIERDEHPASGNVAASGLRTAVNGANEQSVTQEPPAAESLSSSPVDARRTAGVSEWSHQQLAPRVSQDEVEEKEDDWQDMPAYATHTIYDDWGKVLARETAELDEEAATYGHLGGAGKGYTKVGIDEDAESATSMDDNTAYLFKENTTRNTLDEDEEGRDMLSQMQATKGLLTEGQRIAYVGVVRLSMVEMTKELDLLERTRGAKKHIEFALENMKLWSQKMMVRLYGHMEIDSAEQIMIEQLAEHGVRPGDLTPALMQNSRVNNPARDSTKASPNPSLPTSPVPPSRPMSFRAPDSADQSTSDAPPSYSEEAPPEYLSVKDPSQLGNQSKIDIDLRWTVLCDLFLVLIADSVYDSRSRTLLEKVGAALEIPWIDICRFEKRVTDALEMQEAANKENWNEDEHLKARDKSARNRRLMMMGLATVGGGLVIGLSAGLLAPVIGAGLAAGFTTFGVAGTSTFLGGVGGAAMITSTGVIAGSTVGVRASKRRMGAVKTFEYRPLHNNKRVNLIVTVAGWMTGKVDDVRLPYSTVDPVMGDMYAVYWEPEMLQSMGQTINILATEALTQGLQQILGSTILIALMSALQLPIVLTKLSYLIDNPWSVSLARADLAGLILADSLIDRNLGVRPITLVGFSLGSRVIFSCLKELANRGAIGVIQNAYLFGSPVIAKKDEYLRARTVVSGRFVNGYTKTDWILGYLFRATSGGISRVSGLAPVEVPGIENHDVTEFVPGHMSYRTAMPRLLQEVGWMVDSLEFSEIEDPDPDNHDARQRELLNEIEEARRELEKKPSKRGLKGFFARSKKQHAEKQEWETYDERSKAPVGDGEAGAGDDDPTNAAGGNVLFDIDAIKAEAAQLAAEGIEIKELKSTLPPMKLNIDRSSGAASPSAPLTPLSPSYNADSRPSGEVRHAKSYSGTTTSQPVREKDVKEVDGGQCEDVKDHAQRDEGLGTSQRPPLRTASTMPGSQNNEALGRNAWADEEEQDHDAEVSMTFE